jgi:hypothetical protein
LAHTYLSGNRTSSRRKRKNKCSMADPDAMMQIKGSAVLIELNQPSQEIALVDLAGFRQRP